MKTISKILIAVVIAFTFVNVHAQTISKNKMLTNAFNPWKLVVNYSKDPGSTNYYLLSVGNEEFGKKKERKPC